MSYRSIIFNPVTSEYRSFVSLRQNEIPTGWIVVDQLEPYKIKEMS